MTDQQRLPLDDLSEARARRDDAMAAVADASAEWITAAYGVLVEYAERVEYVEPWRWLHWAVTEAGLEPPEEARATGPLFQRASRRGLLERTSTFLPSPSSHASPKRLWRSAVFTGPRTGCYFGLRVDEVAA